jgi:hypothetical protein
MIIRCLYGAANIKFFELAMMYFRRKNAIFEDVEINLKNIRL